MKVYVAVSIWCYKLLETVVIYLTYGIKST